MTRISSKDSPCTRMMEDRSAQALSVHQELCPVVHTVNKNMSLQSILTGYNVVPRWATKMRCSLRSSLLKRCDTTNAISSSSHSVVLDEDLKASIREFDKMTPRPQSLQKILEASSYGSAQEEVNSFLREEFRIRCAERICMMEEKIPNFHEIPELQLAYTKHLESFAEMRTRNTLDDFIPVVQSIVERGRDIIPLMCQGMSRLIQTQDDMDETFTNKFLNEFLLNRIGSNVLMSQYLAVSTGDTSSIIDPHCNVTAICRETARKVQQLCIQETGFRPSIQVESYQNADLENFAFIPAVISYIVQELLKNSSVATAKQKKTRSRMEDRTISVVVSADEQRVMIHIGDRAGGIPFDVGQHIWSYLYSTKRGRKQDPVEPATNLGGYGVGLPLSRLYASYLGGTINLVSLPGYGTHAYVFLPRLPEKMVESVPIRASGWEATKSGGEFIL